MKNFILGFLTATLICGIVAGMYVYPIYQEYKRYERAKVEVVEKAKAAQGKLQGWKAKFTKNKE